MQTAKQEALNAINKLPENTGMDEIMCRLYVLDEIRKVVQDIREKTRYSGAVTQSGRKAPELHRGEKR